MSKILQQRWLLNRRHYLRGLGATVALPFLDAMRPLRAAATPAEAPRRSVFVYIPNGVNGMTWQVKQAGKDYEFSPSLRPLAKHRDDLTIFSGLYHPNGIGSAHVCGDLWLTGARLDTNQRSARNTVSCDQVMAEVAGRHTRFTSLELSVTAGVGMPNGSTTLAFSRDGVPLPAEQNPRAVFERLYGETPGGAKAEGEQLQTRRSVLDAVLGNAKSLRRALGQEDRTKLDEYLHAVRDVEMRTERLESWLDVPRPVIPKQEAAHYQRNVSQSEAGDYYRTMYDLIVLALRTDTTRVVTYMSGSEGKGLAIPEIGITQSRHQLSHHNGDADALDRLSLSDLFLMEQFAYFLDQLQNHKDGETPLLDRTMVLTGSGMSYGQSHHNASLPILLAGGRGLGIKHGQHVDYNLPSIGNYKLDYEEWRTVTSHPKDETARLSNLFLTMLQKMDVPADKFVDSVKTIGEIL